MNDIFDLSTKRLIQTSHEPVSIGDTLVVNGKFLVPAPDGTAYEVEAADSPYDVGVKAASALLVRYPMYENVAYSFFTEVADMDGIESAGPVPGPAGLTKPRCFMGRGGVGPAPTGVATGSVGILPANPYATVAEPGLLLSTLIDISGTAPAGTDNVLIWWQIASCVTSEDTVTGTNPGPAIKTLEGIDQEPGGLTVYVSNDDGMTWYAADRLLPVNLVNPGTDLRIAFVNSGTSRLYLLGYAILYSGV